MVYEREDVVGLDAAIVMNPEVWEASGHMSSFTDPLVECKACHKRFRSDKPELLAAHEKEHKEKVEWTEHVGSFTDPLTECKSCHKRFRSDKPELLAAHEKEHKEKVEWTESKIFNLLTEVLLGVTEPKMTAYLRGEITQGVFVNFRNVVDSTRVKVPFGVAQIGKAFRNEITPGNLTFRSREFEQMELEYFVRPDEKNASEVFEYWKQARMAWYLTLGMHKTKLRFREHRPEERAHYAKKAWDIEYEAPFGWSEFEGIHHRGDWDLSRHKLVYTDPETNEGYTPWVIETSGGVDRATLFFLIDAYVQEEKRIVLKLHSRLAPVKAAVFPLVSNKPDIVKKAREVYTLLKKHFVVAWDDRGNIGKRYLSQDEIGTPWCLTIDYDTLGSDTVTVRDRDTMSQTRINISQLQTYIQEKLGGTI